MFHLYFSRFLHVANYMYNAPGDCPDPSYTSIYEGYFNKSHFDIPVPNLYCIQRHHTRNQISKLQIILSLARYCLLIGLSSKSYKVLPAFHTLLCQKKNPLRVFRISGAMFYSQATKAIDYRQFTEPNGQFLRLYPCYRHPLMDVGTGIVLLEMGSHNLCIRQDCLRHFLKRGQRGCGL